MSLSLGGRANVNLRKLIDESLAYKDCFVLNPLTVCSDYFFKKKKKKQSLIYLLNHMQHFASLNIFAATICLTLKKFSFLI